MIIRCVIYVILAALQIAFADIGVAIGINLTLYGDISKGDSGPFAKINSSQLLCLATIMENSPQG